MGKIWNNFIEQTKKSFMKFPCSFSGTILYTIFMTIFIDKQTFSEELLVSITIVMGMFVALSLNIESLKQEKRERIIYEVCAFEVGIILAVLANVFHIFEVKTLVAAYYLFFLIAVFLALLLTFIYIVFKKQKRSFSEYFKHVFLGIIEVSFKYSVLAIGFLIISLIFSALITDDLEDQLLKIQLLLFGCYYIPHGIYTFVDHEKKDSEFLKLVFKDILSILLVVAFAVIYAYMFKILFTLEIPSNQVFPILSFLFIVGLPIWTVNTVYEDSKIWNKINKYLPYAFIPFIILQMISIIIRITSYGLTEARYLGMMLIIFEVIYIGMYITKHKLQDMLLVTIVLIFVTFICPVINMTNVSLISQYSRLNHEFRHKNQDNYQFIVGPYEYFYGNAHKMEYLSKKYTTEELNELKTIRKEYYNNRYSPYTVNNYSYYGDIKDKEIDITEYTKLTYFSSYSNYTHVLIGNNKYDFSNLVNEIILEGKDLYQDNTYYADEDVMIKFTRAYISYEKDKTPTYVELEGYAFIK